MSLLVSIIIPCYKQAHYLNECIASLQAQTHVHWEAIIVNDGSPDDTAKVAAILCAADSRIRYIEKKNGGLSSARNAGLAVAKGDFVQFLDADDLLLPDKLSVHLHAVAGNKTSFLTYTDYFHGDCRMPFNRVETGRLSCELVRKRPVEDFALRWEFEFSIPIHAALFPSWLFRDKDIRFNEKLTNHEDWFFWMSIASYFEKFIFIPKELCIYRFDPKSMSRNQELMFAVFNDAIKIQLEQKKLDHQVVKCLKYLSRRNKFTHHRDIKGRFYPFTKHKIFKKLPWPIQKKLLVFFSTPPTHESI